MTKEINALYDGKKLIRESYDFRWIDHDARELTKSGGSAVVIRVREGFPDFEHSKIDVLKYGKDGLIKNSEESFFLPRSLLELIAEIYKK